MISYLLTVPNEYGSLTDKEPPFEIVLDPNKSSPQVLDAADLTKRT